MDETYKVLSMKSLASRLNDLTYTDYYYRLMLKARAVFEWENLPNGIDEKWIERFLYAEGKCVFFKHPDLGFMICRCTPSGQLNNYDEPTKVTPIGTNFTYRELKNFDESVLIRNNDEMIPTMFSIQMFAYRLADISRTIDINVNAQKTPVLIRTTERKKNSLKNLYSQWSGNEPVIYGDKNGLDDEPMETLDTKAPVVFDKLQIQKHEIWNEAMTFLGINNANMNKRERLVDDEVQANNEQIKLSAQVMLKARELACEQINKMFGTNISVKLRDGVFEECPENALESDLRGDLDA